MFATFQQPCQQFILATRLAGIQLYFRTPYAARWAMKDRG